MKTGKLSVAIILLIIILLILQNFQKPKPLPIEIQKIDTVTIIKPIQKVVVRRAKPRIVYRIDTVVVSKPFIASFDTIVHKDTISLSYRFPENMLDFSLSTPPDTFKIPEIKYSFDKKKEKWWEKPAFFVLGTAFGYLLCKIR